MKKKCLFLTTAINQGGIETYLLRFLLYNNRRFHSIVLCKSGNYGQLYDDYLKIADGVEARHLGYFDVVAYIRFFFYLRRSHFDTVCDFTGNFAGMPLFVAKLAGVKKRIALYRGSTNHFAENWSKLFYNFCIKKITQYSATKILSNSNAAFDFFFGKAYVGKEKYEVIYNGVDFKKISGRSRKSLRVEFGIDSSCFVVGHIGRCGLVKNHDTIIRVAMTLCRKYSNIHFVLVGKGVDEKYDSVVQLEGLEGKIHLLGYIKNASCVLPLFDLFYFPSLTEGQSNALIEAMVTGLPVLASDIPSIQETVPDEMHSLLLSPCDIDKAVEVIERLYHYRNELKQYQCMEWAKHRYDASLLFEKFAKQL